MGGDHSDAGRRRIVGLALGVGPFALGSDVWRRALNTSNAGLTPAFNADALALVLILSTTAVARRLAWFFRRQEVQ